MGTEWIGFDEEDLKKDKQENGGDSQSPPSQPLPHLRPFIQPTPTPPAPPRVIVEVFMNSYRHCGMDWMHVGDKAEIGTCPCCGLDTTPLTSLSLLDIQT